jgi:hypothetical protein
MLMPDNEGTFYCDQLKCTYDTDNLFELLEHQGVEYTWGIRLSSKHSFDFFQFLKAIDESLTDAEEIYTIVQSALMLFINASRDEIDDFVMESAILTESEGLIENIEKMLENEEK